MGEQGLQEKPIRSWEVPIGTEFEPIAKPFRTETDPMARRGFFFGFCGLRGIKLGLFELFLVFGDFRAVRPGRGTCGADAARLAWLGFWACISGLRINPGGGG